MADAATTGPWGRIWTRALVLALVVLASLEGTLRVAGFRPIVRDDPPTWAAARRSVEPASVVFAGSSRMQADIDLDTWAESWGGARPVQLAIAGATPLPVVEDLARDGAYHGLLVAGIVPPVVFGSSPQAEEDALRMIAEHDAALVSPARRAEARLRIFVSARLAIWSLPPDQLRWRLLAPQGPRVPYFTMGAGRTLRLDFVRNDVPRQIRMIAEDVASRGPGLEGAALEALIARFQRAESALLARGAQLVWLQMPRGGRVEAVERASFPDAEYWSAFRERMRGVVVDATRIPELDSFQPPDGSHLDVRDAPAFTRALAEELRSRLDTDSH